MVQLHIVTNNTGAKPSGPSPIAYNQFTNSRPTLQVSKSLDDEVSSPPKGFFASIKHAFFHPFEFVKKAIWRKKKVNSSTNEIYENDTETAENEHDDHSKSSFESIKNIFARIPYFGSFFSTRNEIKEEIKNTTETENSDFKNQEDGFLLNADITASKAVDNVGSSNDSREEKVQKQIFFKVPTQEEIKKQLDEIYCALIKEEIPSIPKEILPCLELQDLTRLRGALVFKCLNLKEKGRHSKKQNPGLYQDMKLCKHELRVRKELQNAAKEQRDIENYHSNLSGEMQDESSKD